MGGLRPGAMRLVTWPK